MSWYFAIEFTIQTGLFFQVIGKNSILKTTFGTHQLNDFFFINLIQFKVMIDLNLFYHFDHTNIKEFVIYCSLFIYLFFF